MQVILLLINLKQHNQRPDRHCILKPKTHKIIVINFLFPVLFWKCFPPLVVSSFTLHVFVFLFFFPPHLFWFILTSFTALIPRVPYLFKSGLTGQKSLSVGSECCRTLLAHIHCDYRTAKQVKKKVWARERRLERENGMGENQRACTGVCIRQKKWRSGANTW